MTRHDRQDGKAIGQETVPGLERMFTLRDSPELIRRIMWSPRDCTIAAPRDGTVVIWDAERGTAKTEPDGLGSMLEADCLRGAFQMSADVRLRDGGQEELVLLATVKELLEHDLALREHADGGTYLVFPSQCLRDWPAA